MKNLFPIILILSVLTLSNCTKQIDFDEQDIAPRIVVIVYLPMTLFGLLILAEVSVYWTIPRIQR